VRFWDTIKHKRRLAHDKNYAAEGRGTVDVGAAVDSVFVDMDSDVDLGKTYAGQYAVKKLLLAARAGILDVERDGELLQLRRLMKSSLFKPAHDRVI